MTQFRSLFGAGCQLAISLQTFPLPRPNAGIGKFVYLKAQLIDTRTGQIAADFVVEIKGPQKKLTKKGTEALARQISSALESIGADYSKGSRTTQRSRRNSRQTLTEKHSRRSSKRTPTRPLAPTR